MLLDPRNPIPKSRRRIIPKRQHPRFHIARQEIAKPEFFGFRVRPSVKLVAVEAVNSDYTIEFSAVSSTLSVLFGKE